MRCSRCKRKIDVAMKFCPKCGNDLIVQRNRGQVKNVRIMVVTCVMLVVMVICFVNSRPIRYKKAMNLYEKRDYAKAVEAFGSIKNYGDSEKMLTKAQYSCAKEYYKEENYAEAEALLSEISDYKDSEDLLAEIWYASAIECMDNEDYEKALDLIKKYEVSTGEKSIEEATLLSQKGQIAEAYVSQGKYEKALELYQELGDTWKTAEMSANLGEYVKALELTKEYKCDNTQKAVRENWQREQGILYAKEEKYEDAWKFMKEYNGKKDEEWCQAAYQTARVLAKNKQYAEAVKLSEKAKVCSFEAEHLLKECYQELGILYVEEDCETAWKYLSMCDVTEKTAPHLSEIGTLFMEKGYFVRAVQVWEKLGDYQDTASQVKKCYRLWGKYYEDSLQFEEALEKYSYCDDPALITECYYVWASVRYACMEYEEALKLYSEIPEYKDSKEMATLCSYEWAKQLYENQAYESADKLFTELGEYEDSVEMAKKAKEQIEKKIEAEKKRKEEEQLLNQWKERVSVLDGSWETDSGKLKITIDSRTEWFRMIVKFYEEEVNFGGEDQYYRFTWIGVDWDELPSAKKNLYPDYTIEYNIHDQDKMLWDYKEGYLYLGGIVENYENGVYIYPGKLVGYEEVYPCTVNGDTMLIQIGRKSFTLTKK